MLCESQVAVLNRSCPFNKKNKKQTRNKIKQKNRTSTNYQYMYSAQNSVVSSVGTTKWKEFVEFCINLVQWVQGITTRLILPEFSVVTVQKRFQIGERMCSSQPSPSRASLGTDCAAGVLSNKTSKLQVTGPCRERYPHLRSLQDYCRSVCYLLFLFAD